MDHRVGIPSRMRSDRLELDRGCGRRGIGVRSVLAHPGYASMNLQSSGPTGVMKVGNPSGGP